MKPLKILISFLVTVTILLSLVPAAIAADNESVLMSVGHTDTDVVTISGSARDITLTAPYGSSGTVDLSNGLAITWDEAAYKSVVATSSSAAQIGGAAVTLTVTYNHKTDAAGTPKSTTLYSVKVVEALPVDPVFAGTITKQQPLSGGAFSFTNPGSDNDFENLYAQNDGAALSFISLSGSNPSFGALKLSGNVYPFGTPVSMASIDSDLLTFVPVLTGSAGTVSYDVTGYTGTAPNLVEVGRAVLTITCYDVPVINSDIAMNAAKGEILTFSPSFFTNHCDMKGMPLASVEITPTGTSHGVWSLAGSAFTTAKVIPAAQLNSLKYTADTEGTATFNWRISNHDTDFSTSASGAITITSVNLMLSAYTGGSELMKGNTWAISSSHFGYTPHTASLSYIKITEIPNAADGYLSLTTSLAQNSTYGYPAITANSTLKAGSVIPVSYLGYLRMVTKNTSKNDDISFKWTATADMKISSANWAEAVTYTVRFAGGGTLSYSTDMNVPLTLPSTDIASRFYASSGYTLSYVTFTLPDKKFGTLYLDYDLLTKKGTAVSASTKYYTGKSPNLANVCFVPADDYTGIDTITYMAYTENGAYFTGTISINVSNSLGGTISLITDKNAPLRFDGAVFQSAFQSATGKSLSYVRFSLPSSTCGTLYYNYTSAGRYESAVTSGSVYYLYDSRYISYVSFVPHKDFTGTVTVSFTAYAETGGAYSGKAVINVIDSPAGIVSYSLVQNRTAALSGNDFSDEFISVTGSVLSYVTFKLPQSSEGTLYYEYDADTKTGTAVGAATKYYDGSSPDISDITFVPAENYAGTVTVAYTAHSTTGTEYTGKLKFNIQELSQTIYYTSDGGEPVTMRSGDFINAFGLLSSGQTLSAVSFDLPSSTCGKFYYDYSSPSHYDSAVSAGKKYYVSTSPYISRVSFVPSDSYTGTFTVSYTGYTSAGDAFTGKVRITVIKDHSGVVAYETNAMAPVTFNAADFVSAYTGAGTLSYVKFTLPSSSGGTLYYSYSSPSSYTSTVSAASYYYVNGWPNISSITFVPSSSYSGALAMEYTAYNTAGDASSGTVLITVDSRDLDVVTYAAFPDEPIEFNSEDFNTVFMEKTGMPLQYVRFTLPSFESGKLYLDYVSASDYGTAVSASANYYRAYTPSLDDISFVPKAGYTGSVTIAYVGYTASGKPYTGKIIIDVGSSVPFTDMQSGYGWASDAVSYLYRNGIINGQGNNQFSPSDSMTRGDFVLMIARAFDLSGGTDNFSDVSTESYYYDAISAAKKHKVVTGTDGQFFPDEAISRQDAMVIIMRVLDAEDMPLTAGTSADLKGFGDADEISDYAVKSVASLVKAGIITGSNGRLYPLDAISRAEMAVILYRALTM